MLRFPQSSPRLEDPAELSAVPEGRSASILRRTCRRIRRRFLRSSQKRPAAARSGGAPAVNQPTNNHRPTGSSCKVAGPSEPLEKKIASHRLALAHVRCFVFLYQKINGAENERVKQRNSEAEQKQARQTEAKRDKEQRSAIVVRK